jgi:hypothetical protein
MAVSFNLSTTDKRDLAFNSRSEGVTWAKMLCENRIAETKASDKAAQTNRFPTFNNGTSDANREACRVIRKTVKQSGKIVSRLTILMKLLTKAKTNTDNLCAGR